MRGGLFRRYTISRRLLRPLIGIVVAYAVAAQSLLIALGGFSLPVRGADGAVAFELCLHDSQGSSNSRRTTPTTLAAPIAYSVLPDHIMRSSVQLQPFSPARILK